jgi:L-proline amide hydrolase
MSSTEGRLDWAQGQTWYRVVGAADASPDSAPVVILHGGPGAPHDYVEPIADLLAATGRTCVLYDQLGCGRSQHRPDAPPEFWTPQLFKDELAALLEHLGYQERYMVLGQSWGGMLGMEHAVERPRGLQALVIADSPASMVSWVEEANRLRAELPAEVEATLRLHEDAETTDDPAYEAAMQVFYDRHVCRVPVPDCVRRTFAQIAEDPTVYHSMNGPSEFHVIGSLTGWDITDRLGRINVPTLLVSGRYDEATPRIMRQVQAAIPGARWELFEWSSHMPHIEEPAHFRDIVADFLTSVEASPTG